MTVSSMTFPQDYLRAKRLSRSYISFWIVLIRLNELYRKSFLTLLGLNNSPVVVQRNLVSVVSPKALRLLSFTLYRYIVLILTKHRKAFKVKSGASSVGTTNENVSEISSQLSVAVTREVCICVEIILVMNLKWTIFCPSKIAMHLYIWWSGI